MSNLVPTGRFTRRYRFEDTGCGWTTAVTLVAPAADALTGSILVDGNPVPASAFSSFATSADWAVATVELACDVTRTPRSRRTGTRPI